MNKINILLNDLKFVRNVIAEFAVWQYDKYENKEEWYRKYFGLCGAGERQF